MTATARIFREILSDRSMSQSVATEASEIVDRAEGNLARIKADLDARKREAFVVIKGKRVKIVVRT